MTLEEALLLTKDGRAFALLHDCCLYAVDSLKGPLVQISNSYDSPSLLPSLRDYVILSSLEPSLQEIFYLATWCPSEPRSPLEALAEQAEV